MARADLLIMFAKAPVAGRVKTRLQPTFTPAQSASLHAAFLLDLSERLLAGGDRWDGWLSLAGEENAVIAEIRGFGVEVVEQAGGGLGDRMAAAIEAGLAAGYETVTLIGSDAPTLPEALVAECIGNLKGGGADDPGSVDRVVSFVPSFDGGFAAISARSPLPALRGAIPWSTAETLAATIRALEGDNKLSALTAFWYDVDEAADVTFLTRHLLGALGMRAGSIAPRTAAWLIEQGVTGEGLV